MNFNFADVESALRELGMTASNAVPETVQTWLSDLGLTRVYGVLDRTRPGNFSTVRDALEAIRLIDEISAEYRADLSRHYNRPAPPNGPPPTVADIKQALSELNVAPVTEPAAVQGSYRDTANYTQSLDSMFHKITAQPKR